jgi:hypothetical protein
MMTDARYAEIVRRTLHPTGEHDEDDRITALERIVRAHDATLTAQCKCINSLLAIIARCSTATEPAI